jgi:hypothetical protein
MPRFAEGISNTSFSLVNLKDECIWEILPLQPLRTVLPQNFFVKKKKSINQ